MKSASDVIEQLEQTTSRLEKESIIQTAWDNHIYEFFDGAQLAYDPLITFGVKKVPLIESDLSDELFQSSITWDKFRDIALKLSQREITGNAARDLLRNLAETSSIKEWNTFYRRVLLKDLKCGITETTINKILNKNGKDAAKFIIPLFSCQLAKSGDDNKKKLVGPKFLDVKLDGVRILSILDKSNNTVTQYSREGRINENFPHIRAILEKLLPHIKTSMVLDGEMVSKTFQDLMKQLNRKDTVDTKDAKLALFDCLPLEDFKNGEYALSQTQRHAALIQFQPIFDNISNGAIYILPKLLVNLDTEAGNKTFTEFNAEAIEMGYEGVMIKEPSASYKTKRTDAWLKIKPFITVDLEIVDVEAGKPESRFAHTLGGILCKGVDTGREIEVWVGSGFTEELRDEIWKNRDKVIGRLVEIKGDALTKNEKSDNVWSLRFPTFERFRGWTIGEKL